jgi:pimeloyl-ACP methyl ester carboxylesterase
MNYVTEEIDTTEYAVPPIQVAFAGDECETGQAAQGEKHAVILHGWNSKASDMFPVRDALRKLAPPGWMLHTLSYDSHDHSFRESANDIAAFLERQGLARSSMLLIGYSMGGVVARQMAADGFPCAALVTVCAPHRGTAAWVPTPNKGSLSIAPHSEDIRNLNAMYSDRKLRGRYYFHAVTYTDIRGYQDNDTVVEKTSALGLELGPEIHRHAIHLSYSGGFSGFDPHWMGMNPDYLRPLLDTCGRLFRSL